MPTVKIKSIKAQCTANKESYKWLLEHLNEPLQLFSVTFTDTGEISTFAVHRDDTCVTVFVYENAIDYEVDLCLQ